MVKRFLFEKWVKGFSYSVLCVVTKQNKSKVNKLCCEDTLATWLSLYTKAGFLNKYDIEIIAKYNYIMKAILMH